MPKYQIDVPGSGTFEVESPTDLSDAQAYQAVMGQIRNTPKPQGGIMGALKQGAETYGSQVKTGITGAFSHEDANQAAIEGLQRQEEIGQKYEAGPSLDAITKAYKEKGLLSAAGEAISQVPKAIAGQGAQLGAMGVSSAIGSIIGGGLGTAVEPGVGTVVGAGLGAKLGATFGQALSEFPQFFGAHLERQAQEQIKSGQPVDVNRGKAALGAAGSTAIDVVEYQLLFGSKILSNALGMGEKSLAKMPTEAVEKIAQEKLLPMLLKGTAKGAAVELPSEITQQIIERAQAGLPLTSPDAINEYGSTAYQVALLGPLGIIGRSNARGEARTEASKRYGDIAAQQAIEAEQAKAAAPTPPDETGQTGLNLVGGQETVGPRQQLPVQQEQPFVGPEQQSPQMELDFEQPYPKSRLQAEPPIIGQGEQPKPPQVSDLEWAKQRLQSGAPLTPTQQLLLQEDKAKQQTAFQNAPAPQLEIPNVVGAGSRPTSHIVDDNALSTFGFTKAATKIKNDLRGLDLMKPEDAAKFDDLTSKHERKNAKIDMQAVQDFKDATPEAIAPREVPERAGIPAKPYDARTAFQQGREAQFAFGQGPPVSPRDTRAQVKAQAEAQNVPGNGIGFVNGPDERSVQVPSTGVQTAGRPAASKPTRVGSAIGTTEQPNGRTAPSGKVGNVALTQMAQQVAPKGKAAIEQQEVPRVETKEALEDQLAKEPVSKDTEALMKELGIEPAERKPTTYRVAASDTNGLTKERVESIVKAVTGLWKNAPDIKTVQSEMQLPPAIQAQIKRDGVRRPEGVWSDADNCVFLIAGNIANAQNAVLTIAHETTGHFGIRGILGDTYLATMNRIYEGNPEVKALADNKIDRGMDPATAVEEVLAEFAENTPNPTVMQRIVNIIRQAFAKVGFPMQGVTNGEIKQLLKDARKFVIEGKGGAKNPSIKIGQVYSADGPLFYSRLGAMVQHAPKDLSKGASGAQWAGWIKSNASKFGVKAEELEWTGVEDVLALMDKGTKLTTQDVAKMIADAGVKVEETQLGGREGAMSQEDQDRIQELEAKHHMAVSGYNAELTKLRNVLESKDISPSSVFSPDFIDDIYWAMQTEGGNLWQHIKDMLSAKPDIDYFKTAFIRSDINNLSVMQNGDFETYGIYDKDLKQVGRNFQNKDAAVTALDNMKVAAHFKTKEWVPTALIHRRENLEKIDKELSNLEIANENKMPRYKTWSMADGENYGELVLRLPLKTPDTSKWTIKEAPGFAHRPQEKFYAVLDTDGNEVSTFHSYDDAKAFIGRAAEKPTREYNHPHWPGIDNPIVHIRFNERTDENGERVLFLEEIQSDWGQKGAKYGFDPKVRRAKVNALIEKQKEANEVLTKVRNKAIAEGKMRDVFDAGTEEVESLYKEYEKITSEIEKLSKNPPVEKGPFVQDAKLWTALAVKRALRYAADNGINKIAFINGEEAHKRFPEDEDGNSTEEGMRTHYDVRVPSVFKDVLRKLGASTEPSTSTFGVQNPGYYVYVEGERALGPFETYDQANIEAAEVHFGGGIPQENIKIHQDDTPQARTFTSFDLAPETTAKVKEGQALFREARTPEGQDAESLMAEFGGRPQESQKGYIQKKVDNFNKAKDSWTEAYERNHDWVAATFGKGQNIASFDQAFNNRMYNHLMGEAKKGNMALQNAKTALLRISTSQALHRGNLANQIIERGDYYYDSINNRWEAVDSKDGVSMTKFEGLIKDVAKKLGIEPSRARQIMGAAYEANRLNSMYTSLSKTENEIALLEKEMIVLRRNKKRTEADKKVIALKEGRLKQLEETQEDLSNKVQHKTKAQVDAGMKLYNAHAEIAEGTKVWNKMRDLAVNMLVKTGVKSKDEAERWLDDAAYVPFFRDMDEEKAAGPNVMARGLRESMKDFAMKGSMRQVQDPIENMYQWMQWSMARAISNKQLQVMLEQYKSVLPEEVREGPSTPGNTFTIYYDGIQRKFSVADPAIAQAFVGLEPIVFPGIGAAVKATNALRHIVTRFPLFSAVQLFSDSYSAMYSSGLKSPFGVLKEIAKEVGKTAAGTSETREMLKRTGILETHDYTAMREEDAIAKRLGLDNPSKWTKLMSNLDRLSSASDNVIRQGVYNQGIKEGLSHTDAMERATEIVNFRRISGDPRLQFASRVIPFFNAYLQVNSVLIKTLTGRGVSPQERSAARAALISTTAKIAVLSFIYSAAVGDDEDYKRKNRISRDRMFMIPGSGGYGIPIRTDMFALPKIIGEYTYQMMGDHSTTDSKMLKQAIGHAVLGSFMPPSQGIPQIVRPGLEVATNHDFFQDREIVNATMRRLDTDRQFTKNTSEMAKALGQASGLSPLVVDHLLRGYFGTAMTLTALATNDLINAARGGPPRPDKSIGDMVAALPNMGSFVSKDENTAVLSDFYEAARDVNKANATLKSMKNLPREEQQAYREEHKKEIQLHGMVNTMQQQLIKLKQREQKIVEDVKMSVETKQAEIKRINAQRDRMSTNVSKLRQKLYD